MLKAGIIGLPNVGKSTLFNAVTRSHKAAAANYPFCTIEPNLGVVSVPDERLARIAQLVKVSTVIPTAFEFVDIAGLVRGASHGEGLGNKFLSHIREVDALIHVVRCFEDPDIVHVTGSLDPKRDIEIVATELLLADLESIRKRLEKIARDVKRGDKHALLEAQLLERLQAHLNAGNPANTLGVALAPEEKLLIKSFSLLTDKAAIFVANIKESQLAGADTDPRLLAIREYARTHHACETVVLSVQLESDLGDLSPAEAQEYLKELGIAQSGLITLLQVPIACWGCAPSSPLTRMRSGPGPCERETRPSGRPGQFTPILSGVLSKPKPCTGRNWLRPVPSLTPGTPGTTESRVATTWYGMET